MRKLLPFAALLFLATSVLASEPPRTAVWNGERLREVKASAKAPDSPDAAALKALAAEAKAALARGPYAVTDKKKTPLSGDKHDYVSYGTYWWPDPDTADGLPYIRRDGHLNPESHGDRDALDRMATDVETLALAAYLLDDRDAGKHAAKLLRTWFLDSKTRMNPHLKYGQAIPGRTEGRGIGIIDTTVLVYLLDAVELLRASGNLQQPDLDGLQSWFRDYLDWLRTSSHGQDEAATKNNHGTWYDVQCVRFALFVGDQKLAREVLAAAATRRIAEQIEPDGSQPHELDRTRSLTYSLLNLTGLNILASIGERFQLDLWQKDKSDGRLRAAINFLCPYLAGDKPWPYEQLGPLKNNDRTLIVLLLASHHFDDPRYASILKHFRKKNPAERIFLLFP